MWLDGGVLFLWLTRCAGRQRVGDARVEHVAVKPLRWSQEGMRRHLKTLLLLVVLTVTVERRRVFSEGLGRTQRDATVGLLRAWGVTPTVAEVVLHMRARGPGRCHRAHTW